MTDRYKRIREALAMGPTHGPWHATKPEPHGTEVRGPAQVSLAWCGGATTVGEEGCYSIGAAEAAANAHFIAACSPDRIRRLLYYIRALLDERDALEAENERLLAEVAEWKRVAAAQAELHGEAEDRAEQLAEDAAWCAECGVKLEIVRPGKHQHPTCSQAQPLTDEALLRQALEALELRCGTNADERKELIPALRERLGEKE